MKHNTIFVAVFVLVAWTPGLLGAESAPAVAAPFTPAQPALSSPAIELPGLFDPIPLAVNCEVACERNYNTCVSPCRDFPCVDRCLSVRYECRCSCPNPDPVECSGLP